MLCELFAYSVFHRPCWFVYISSSGEEYDFAILVLGLRLFGFCLASIWLHFIWYLAADLPQGKNLACFCRRLNYPARLSFAV